MSREDDNVIDFYDNSLGYTPLCCRPGGRCTPEGSARAKAEAAVNSQEEDPRD